MHFICTATSGKQIVAIKTPYKIIYYSNYYRYTYLMNSVCTLNFILVILYYLLRNRKKLFKKDT